MSELHHPITPPSLQQWRADCPHFVSIQATEWIATQAAEWGWEKRGDANEAEQLKIRDEVADKAYQLGWDQRGAVNEAKLQKARDEELKACEEFLRDDLDVLWDGGVPGTREAIATSLRAARRPKPPSQAEEALGLLNEGLASDLFDHEVAIIRSALERLREHEQQQQQQQEDQ